MNEVKGEWVNRIILDVAAMSPQDGNVQLSILSRALIRAAKLLGVDKDIVLANLTLHWDSEKVIKQ